MKKEEKKSKSALKYLAIGLFILFLISIIFFNLIFEKKQPEFNPLPQSPAQTLQTDNSEEEKQNQTNQNLQNNKKDLVDESNKTSGSGETAPENPPALGPEQEGRGSNGGSSAALPSAGEQDDSAVSEECFENCIEASQNEQECNVICGENNG